MVWRKRKGDRHVKIRSIIDVQSEHAVYETMLLGHIQSTVRGTVVDSLSRKTTEFGQMKRDERVIWIKTHLEQKSGKILFSFSYH